MEVQHLGVPQDHVFGCLLETFKKQVKPVTEQNHRSLAEILHEKRVKALSNHNLYCLIAHSDIGKYL